MTIGDQEALTCPPSPILDQGDVFLNAPVPRPVVSPARHSFADEVGPAILLTHGCMMDKPSPDGARPRIEYLQFSRIRAVADLPARRQELLRNNVAAPYEVLYLGEVLGMGECYTSFLETYHLAASYFDLRFVASGDVERGAACGINDTRVATLVPAQRGLLAVKLPAFWTRQVPG